MSKALEMSRKTPLTSIDGSQSKGEFISWTIDNNCEINESPGRKPGLAFCKNMILMEMIKKLLKYFFVYFAKNWKKVNWSIDF